MTTDEMTAYADHLRATLPEVDVPGLEWALSQAGLVRRGGSWAEFGVCGGGTLARIAPSRGLARLWGFDSCRGLPETWNDQHPKGMFRLDHPPMPPEDVNLVVGWYSDTLPFVSLPDLSFAHIDCDLYSSARTVFAAITRGHWLAADAVFVFDDFLTPPLYNGVMRAYLESGLDFEMLARPRGSDVVVGRVKA